MRTRFEPNQRLIVIPAEVAGPSGHATVRLALDTGATTTLINTNVLVALGYDPARGHSRIQVTTGSSVEYVPRLVLRGLYALGLARRRFPVLCHTLPATAGIDGLLGLDFLKGKRLLIDLAIGSLAILPARSVADLK